MKKRDPRRGSALLAVLWLSIALTAIAFALSRGVRAEFDRASLNIDSTRAYYLARGGVEAAAQRMASRGRADDPSQGFLPGQSYFFFQFPSGRVESQRLRPSWSTAFFMNSRISVPVVESTLPVGYCSLSHYIWQCRCCNGWTVTNRGEIGRASCRERV